MFGLHIVADNQTNNFYQPWPKGGQPNSPFIENFGETLPDDGAWTFPHPEKNFMVFRGNFRIFFCFNNNLYKQPALHVDTSTLISNFK